MIEDRSITPTESSPLTPVLPLEVLTSLTSDGNLSGKFMKMLRYIGYPPVAELLAMLITMGNVPRESELFYLVRR